MSISICTGILFPLLILCSTALPSTARGEGTCLVTDCIVGTGDTTSPPAAAASCIICSFKDL